MPFIAATANTPGNTRTQYFIAPTPAAALAAASIHMNAVERREGTTPRAAATLPPKSAVHNTNPMITTEPRKRRDSLTNVNEFLCLATLIRRAIRHLAHCKFQVNYCTLGNR